MHYGKWILASVAIVMLALGLAAAGEGFDVAEADDPFAVRNPPPPMPLPGDPGEPNLFEIAGDTKRLSHTGTDPSRPLVHADHTQSPGSTPSILPVAGPIADESHRILDALPTPNEPGGGVRTEVRPGVRSDGQGDVRPDVQREAPSEVTDVPYELRNTLRNEGQSVAMPTAETAAAAATAAAAPSGVLGFRVDDSFRPSVGNSAASAVTLEWVRRTEISVGQPCQCDLLVKNAGASAVHDVQVQAYFPQTVRFLQQTKPAPVVQPTHLIWSLGTIPAGQARAIELHLVPSQRGELAAKAFVRFTSGSSVWLEVAEPMLHVELKGPSEVPLGDPTSQIISVSNPGAGVAQNVEIRAYVPAGLGHSPEKQLVLKIGTLNAGEARMVRLALAAVSGGEHVVRVVAEARRDTEAEPYLRQSTEATIRVIAPSVQVKLAGPTLRYKNREATYQVQVTNDGTAVCNNVRVVHNLPDGFQFVAADHGGQHDTVGRTVNWFIGRIEPGQSVELGVTLLASALGQQVHRVAAVTDRGTRAEAEFATVVDGVPALVLKVADQSDPVEVGAETAFEVTVRNEGTKAAENVAVSCELPAGVELVGTEGPTDAVSQTSAVTFATVAALPPGETIQYRLTVRGRQDGFQRLKAQVISESLPQPLSAEELTRFYGQP